MASSLSTLQQHLLCPICLEIFTDPVLLSCGHSFCRTCLQQSWTQSPGRECPVCRRRSSKELPAPDLALRNTCESYLQQKKEEGSRSQGVLCSLHSEKLSMFCVNDEKLVCVQCVTEDHQNHSFCSISKAADSRKETLQTHLQTLEKKLDIFKNVKDNSDRVAAHIKSQFLQTEERIKQEFEKLHQFLRTEEQNRISALRNEEAEKSQKIKNIIKDLENQIKEISTRIRESEDKIKDEALLLQDFKRAIQRAQYTVPDPKPDSVPLIDVAKHLGNLSFNVWRRMKDCCPYYPVVLDPNTANSSLSISADLSSVSISTENHQLPDNPERMSVYEVALGSEGFSSGTHSWVVEVGDNKNWVVGVAEESVNRKERIGAIPENGLYCIWRWNNEFFAGISYSNKKIIAEPTVKRIIVILNWETGQVTFSNFDTKAALHTFINPIRKKMYPYFYNTSINPLKILPLQTSITNKIE
ncbi:E3 ubiquitin-protein ligase TRIM39-like isoform X1 [Astyanax mexicanus]|uniref:E3 ubiquitin-protein ligase TRIM39-like isoform X1 n=1 Tax=Astyanax mexicanus TaxID=7994 RepID=UPI0020CABE86|nr:E3 ubiquitin-protein ligase TRIM39-like isoform X1 [Astyanax mexicanus]